MSSCSFNVYLYYYDIYYSDDEIIYEIYFKKKNFYVKEEIKIIFGNMDFYNMDDTNKNKVVVN